MRIAYARETGRVNYFRVEPLPWILRVYRHPFERWSSVGRRALFGAPFHFLHLLYQRFWPWPVDGFARYTVGGVEKRLRFDSRNTQFRALYLKEFALGYEPHTTALIHLLVPDGGTFWDVGSNWGWFTLSLAARPGFRGKIHAFEPFRSSYADLTGMVRQAGLESVVRCHNVALSDHCGTGTMRLPDFVQSGLATLEESGPGGSATTVASADSLALDPPALIKVDVEGAEEKVFRGAQKTIAAHQPMIVFENSRSAEAWFACLKPMQFLAGLGYVFFRLAWVRQAEGLDCLVGDDFDTEPRPTETLGLVQFEIVERPLLPDSFNIFACHKDKLGDLGSAFRPISA